MTEKERDAIFVEMDSILQTYLPHRYNEPEYVNDICTEMTDWVLKFIEDKCENCGGLL